MPKIKSSKDRDKELEKVKNRIDNKHKKKICQDCKKELGINNFYITKNTIISNDGRINICKECLKKIIDYKDINTIYKVLQILDIPFFFDYWDIVKDKNNPFGDYIRMANSEINEFKNSNYSDSYFETRKKTEENKEENKENIVNKHKNFQITEGICEKWGYGYQPEEYFYFEKKWKKLIDNYGEKTSLHNEGLIVYIRFRVKEEIATANGDIKSAKEWGSLATSAARDAKINVAQLSKSDISGGVELVGQIFEAAESELGIIPLLPKLLEQPYDDADMIIWAIINYGRRLEDKSRVNYKDIWFFYDEMLEEHFKQKGFNEQQIKKFKEKRNNVFRDLQEVYYEPIYEESDSESGD